MLKLKADTPALLIKDSASRHTGDKDLCLYLQGSAKADGRHNRRGEVLQDSGHMTEADRGAAKARPQVRGNGRTSLHRRSRLGLLQRREALTPTLPRMQAVEVSRARQWDMLETRKLGILAKIGIGRTTSDCARRRKFGARVAPKGARPHNPKRAGVAGGTRS